MRGLTTVEQKPKALPIFIMIAALIIVVAGCVAAYAYFTQSWFFKPALPAKPASKTVLLTAENYPKVDASTVTQPLALAFMKNFTGDQSIDETKLGFTQTDEAYSRLIKGQVDLILVTSPSKDELARAQKAGIKLEVTPVVNEGFVFFVNQNNPVDSLTITQVQDIYQGKITNWKQVGGNDEPITAYQRPVNSGSQTGMLDLVMKGKPLTSAPLHVEGTMSGAINTVANYDGNSNDQGICYSYYYYATTIYHDVDAATANNIKLLKINGVSPTTDNIKSARYPLRTAYYIVINAAAQKGSLTRALKKAMLSDRGQRVAREADYVPLR